MQIFWKFFWEKLRISLKDSIGPVPVYCFVKKFEGKLCPFRKKHIKKSKPALKIWFTFLLLRVFTRKIFWKCLLGILDCFCPKIFVKIFLIEARVSLKGALDGFPQKRSMRCALLMRRAKEPSAGTRYIKIGRVQRCLDREPPFLCFCLHLLKEYEKTSPLPTLEITRRLSTTPSMELKSGHTSFCPFEKFSITKNGR